MAHKGFCDNCGRETKIARMSTGGNSGINLCRTCWSKENSWRKTRNKKLTGTSKFPIRKFPA